LPHGGETGTHQSLLQEAVAGVEEVLEIDALMSRTVEALAAPVVVAIEVALLLLLVVVVVVEASAQGVEGLVVVVLVYQVWVAWVERGKTLFIGR
jgi:hypothetical protein